MVTRHRASGALPYALIGLVAIPLLTVRLATYPAIWFDEGYRTNAARTLAERGIYGTSTVDGDVVFDPGISSGPADIGLIAFSFRLFGPGVLQARLVIVLFAALALCALYALAAFLGGPAEALVVVMAILAAPTIQGAGFVFMGRQVLGEIPAFALMLFGILLWTRHWKSRDRLGLWAGAVMGVAIMSKAHVAIALIPALIAIAVGRARAGKSTWLQAFTPIAGLLGAYGLWLLIGWWLTPAAARVDNLAMLRDVIESNLLTPLLGRTLDWKAGITIGVMLTSVTITGVRLRRRGSRLQGLNDVEWLELFLAVFVLCTALWFALFSVGWPRYGFAGLMIAWWLWGRALWIGLMALRRTDEVRERLASRLAIASLAIVAALGNLLPLMRVDPDTRAQAAADYIRAGIPAGAVVESWEWELDALSGHWRFHHPHQRYLFRAIRQLSQTGRVGDLDYDALQADPDYLIAGPFSDRTRLYDPSLVAAHFAEAARIGAYRIYKRVR